MRGWTRHGINQLAGRIILSVSAVLAASQSSVDAAKLNGFEISDLSIDPKAVKRGGPPRDGIQALNYPKFIAANDAQNLRDDDRVLGVALNGMAKAYPIRILDQHEIVNDIFPDQPVVVTYCPLCGSGISFDAMIDGRRTFGVSGLLYNSDVLLFDRQSESLWSQILGTAVSGPLKGRELSSIPTLNTTWGKWKAMHPNTLALSEKTGHNADYRREVYGDYHRQSGLYFSVENRSNLYHNKARVIGLEIDGVAKAYPFVELAFEGTPIQDRVNGVEVTVKYDPVHETAQAFDVNGAEISVTSLYWFAWYTFHPDTLVYTSDKTLPSHRKRWKVKVPK